MATTRTDWRGEPGWEEPQERPERQAVRATRVDAWMAETVFVFGRPVKKQTLFLWPLRILAFVPLIFISRPILTANSTVLNSVEADVLGTGSMLLLLATLLITPLSTISRQRWFVPLRRWYGVMFAVTAFTDATTASITTSFAGGVFGRLAGHTFLLVGLVMTMILIPLFLTGNSWAQKRLGRFWKPLQRMTYVIWALLWLHLALLEGFGVQNGTNGPSSTVDGTPIVHQRLYQLTACSLFLLVFRLPPVKRWVADKQRVGQQWKVYLAVLPLGLLFVFAYAYIINEEIFKGVTAFTLQSADG